MPEVSKKMWAKTICQESNNVSCYLRPWDKCCYCCLDKAALILRTQQITGTINQETDRDAWYSDKPVMKVLSSVLILNLGSNSGLPDPDLVKRWHQWLISRGQGEPRKQRMLLPSASWPRQEESSSRDSSPVPKEPDHLTQGQADRLVKCLPIIFTTVFHGASSCRQNKDMTAYQCGQLAVAQHISGCSLCTVKDNSHQGLHFSSKKTEGHIVACEGGTKRSSTTLAWGSRAGPARPRLFSTPPLQKSTMNKNTACVLTAHLITSLSWGAVTI